jgi:hypothetical protein
MALAPLSSNLGNQLPAPPVAAEVQKTKLRDEFLTFVGLEKQTKLNWDLDGLLRFCDNSLESSVNFYFGNMDEVVQLFPLSNKIESDISDTDSNGNEIYLSCGHVESNLKTENLYEILSLLDDVKNKNISPTHKDGEYWEFSRDNFTIIINSKHLVGL